MSCLPTFDSVQGEWYFDGRFRSSTPEKGASRRPSWQQAESGNIYQLAYCVLKGGDLWLMRQVFWEIKVLESRLNA